MADRDAVLCEFLEGALFGIGIGRGSEEGREEGLGGIGGRWERREGGGREREAPGEVCYCILQRGVAASME